MDHRYSLTLIFHPICGFPLVKVCAYLYASFLCVPLVYATWSRWNNIYNRNQLKTLFFFNCLTLVYNPVFHHPALLCHYSVTSELTYYNVNCHHYIIFELIPLDCPTFCHICKNNCHAFFHILFISLSSSPFIK